MPDANAKLTHAEQLTPQFITDVLVRAGCLEGEGTVFEPLHRGRGALQLVVAADCSGSIQLATAETRTPPA